MLLGAYFGYLLIWTGSLWAPVAAHMLNNMMFVLTAWLQVRDGEPVTKYDLLLVCANWPRARAYAWEHLLIARAIENQS